MFNISELLIEFAKAMSAMVLMGSSWLLVQSAYRRQQCRMGESPDDGELPSCSGCHRIGGCQPASRNSTEFPST
jgi:hypothetical protein